MFTVRDAADSDAARIAELYNELGIDTICSYDLDRVDAAERLAWLHEHRAAGAPVLVGVVDDLVVGFATYTQFRVKAGFQYTVEHSIFIAPEYHHRGIGRALMTELIARARAAGRHAMVGVLDARNTGSAAFHRALGFVDNGPIPQIGRKFGVWGDFLMPVLILSDAEPEAERASVPGQ